MTTRVPLVCTPEELGELLFWSGEVAIELYRLRIGGGNHDAANHAKDRRDAALAALFRPAEEPAPAPAVAPPEPRYPCVRCGMLRTKAEGGTAFTVCDDCWDAPAAPPPAGEPAWMTSELRKNLDCMVFVDAQVFSQARASMVAAIDHAVLSALAALRAENERLRQQLDPPTQSGSFGATTAKVAGNCTKCNGYIYHDPHHIGEYLHECVPPGENRSEG